MLKDHFVIFIAIKHTKTLKPYENVYKNGLYQPLQPTMKTYNKNLDLALYSRLYCRKVINKPLFFRNMFFSFIKLSTKFSLTLLVHKIPF